MGVDVDRLIERLKKHELLTEKEVLWLCDAVRSVLIDESNVVNVSTPVSVLGDIHGQFDDLLEIFSVAGDCPNTNYLCLGDFVDRGCDSVLTISLLTALKLRYPRRITLLRGNHECRAITQTYGFYAECVHKYESAAVWETFTDLFDYFPLAALVDDRYLCLHGGLSPSAHSLDQIRAIFRFKEIPHEGLLTDLLWSDPSTDEDGFNTSPRGAGYTFGGNIVAQFLWTNHLDHIVRGHQLCMEGFQTLFDKQLVTVWSAPNYCYRCGNIASVLELYGGGQEWRFNLFTAVPDEQRHGWKPTVLEDPDASDENGDSAPDYFL